MEIYNLSTGAITAIGVSLLVIFSVVGLIIWNNKIKEQVKALKSIDAKIKEAEEPATEAAVLVKISAETAASREPQQEIQAQIVKEDPAVEGDMKEVLQGEEPATGIEESVQAADAGDREPVACEPEIAFGQEKAEEPQPEVMENNYNVGKSGRVYSKSELLLLIKS